jgi:hypothetical protein
MYLFLPLTLLALHLVLQMADMIRTDDMTTVSSIIPIIRPSASSGEVPAFISGPSGSEVSADASQGSSVGTDDRDPLRQLKKARRVSHVKPDAEKKGKKTEGSVPVKIKRAASDVLKTPPVKHKKDVLKKTPPKKAPPKKTSDVVKAKTPVEDVVMDVVKPKPAARKRATPAAKRYDTAVSSLKSRPDPVSACDGGNNRTHSGVTPTGRTAQSEPKTRLITAPMPVTISERDSILASVARMLDDLRASNAPVTEAQGAVIALPDDGSFSIPKRPQASPVPEVAMKSPLSPRPTANVYNRPPPPRASPAHSATATLTSPTVPSEDSEFLWPAFPTPSVTQSIKATCFSPPAGFEAACSSVGSDNVSPVDSISNVASTHSSHSSNEGSTTVNLTQSCPGLETSVLTGLGRAMPKSSSGRVASNTTNAMWFNMRGYARSNDEWPKADQVEKHWTTESSPAFCPPALPKQLPVDASVTKSDPKAIKRQKSYAAPAHLITDLMDGMSEGVFVPLARAAALNRDPAVKEQLALAHEFLAGQASYQLGLAVRSLGASYNLIASERKAALLRAQSSDVKRALDSIKPGFDKFFDCDVTQVLAVAAQASQLSLTQATLASLAKLSSSNKHSSGGNGKNGNRYNSQSRYNPYNRGYNNNNNSYGNRQWSKQGNKSSNDRSQGANKPNNNSQKSTFKGKSRFNNNKKSSK